MATIAKYIKADGSVRTVPFSSPDDDIPKMFSGCTPAESLLASTSRLNVYGFPQARVTKGAQHEWFILPTTKAAVKGPILIASKDGSVSASMADVTKMQTLCAGLRAKAAAEAPVAPTTATATATAKTTNKPKSKALAGGEAKRRRVASPVDDDDDDSSIDGGSRAPPVRASSTKKALAAKRKTGVGSDDEDTDDSEVDDEVANAIPGPASSARPKRAAAMRALPWMLAELRRMPTDSEEEDDSDFGTGDELSGSDLEVDIGASSALLSRHF